jgi:protein dithiol oxidoreductase (disulfide-forming)
MRKISSLLGAVALATCGLSFIAPSHAQYAEGSDYTRVQPPQLVDDPSKIEVIEFFWYACGVCYRVEPVVQDWKKRQAADVNMRQIPAMGGGFNDMGILFYTLDGLGRLKDLHPKIFTAIHEQNIPLQSKSKRNDWLKANGIEPEKYEQMSTSFSVVSKINRAKQLNDLYKVTSVPRFIVNGQYSVMMQQGRSDDVVFRVIDNLVTQQRKAKGTSTAPATVPLEAKVEKTITKIEKAAPKQ